MNDIGDAVVIESYGIAIIVAIRFTDSASVLLKLEESSGRGIRLFRVLKFNFARSAIAIDEISIVRPLAQ